MGLSKQGIPGVNVLNVFLSYKSPSRTVFDYIKNNFENYMLRMRKKTTSRMKVSKMCEKLGDLITFYWTWWYGNRCFSYLLSSLWWRFLRIVHEFMMRGVKSTFKFTITSWPSWRSLGSLRSQPSPSSSHFHFLNP